MPAPLQVVIFGGGGGGGLEPPRKMEHYQVSIFNISRNVTLLILLVSLQDCLPYLDENIHLYEAHCLTKYFAKLEGKNLKKRNK